MIIPRVEHVITSDMADGQALPPNRSPRQWANLVASHSARSLAPRSTGATVTDRRIRDLYRLVVEAEPSGAKVRVEPTNCGYITCIFSIGEHGVFVIASFSSCAWRCTQGDD